ncbi:hypothetical protein Pelo_627 [Pelomyxa schiedti]|nr:hypothetical protein Pelo_627 [Pelomyxa schiedti]
MATRLPVRSGGAATSSSTSMFPAPAVLSTAPPPAPPGVTPVVFRNPNLTGSGPRADTPTTPTGTPIMGRGTGMIMPAVIKKEDPYTPQSTGPVVLNRPTEHGAAALGAQNQPPLAVTKQPPQEQAQPLSHNAAQYQPNVAMMVMGGAAAQEEPYAPWPKAAGPKAVPSQTPSYGNTGTDTSGMGFHGSGGVVVPGGGGNGVTPQGFLESVHIRAKADIAGLLSQKGGEDLASTLTTKKLQPVTEGFLLSKELLGDVRSESLPYSHKASANAMISDMLSKSAETLATSVDNLNQQIQSLTMEEKRHAIETERTEEREKELMEELERTRQHLAEEKRLTDEYRKKRGEAETMIHVETAKVVLLDAELRSTCSVVKNAIEALSTIESKVRSTSLDSLTAVEIGVLLCELGLAKHSEAFVKAGCDGHMLELLVKDDMCKYYGVTDMVERKLITHTVWLIKATGKIRALPPCNSELTASRLGMQDPIMLQLPHMPAQDVVRWLETNPKTQVHAHKFAKVPGYAFVHLRLPDMAELGIMELRARTEIQDLVDAAHSALTFSYQGVPENDFVINGVPPQWLCTLTGRLMQMPVLGKDCLVYESGAIGPETDCSPMTHEPWTPSDCPLPWTCPTWKKLLEAWKEQSPYRNF